MKWVAIVAPTAFLAVLVSLLRGPFHEELHHFPGYLYVIAVLATSVAVFSLVIFRVVLGLERRVLAQNRELGALVAVGKAVTESPELGDQLGTALDAILAVTAAEIGEVWGVAENGSLNLLQARGAAEEATRPGSSLRAGEGLPGLAVQRREFVHSDVFASDKRCARRELADLGISSYCALPLAHRGRTVGVLAIAARGSDLSCNPEQALLESVGRQLAIAIDNARLRQRILDRAVLEERERIAHELHDGLAQVLGYVNAQTLAIKKLLISGKHEDAAREIAEMEMSTQRVYTDVRLAILGLRLSRGGLMASLRAYFDELARLAPSPPSLEIGDEVAAISFPKTVELQLVRIIQEALANVRKHAGASSTSVSLAVEAGELCVRIVDDGRGFDVRRPRLTGLPHFGLQTMEERARAVGGVFAVDSVPGSGTTVVVRIPVDGFAGGAARGRA